HQMDDYSHLGGQAARSDPIWYPLRRLAIAPAVISRLKEAAGTDEKSATLNPGDLECVMEELHVDFEEQARLRAALLAQGVETFLRERMTPEERFVAQEITEVIYSRLLEQFEGIYAKVRSAEAEGGSSRGEMR